MGRTAQETAMIEKRRSHVAEMYEQSYLQSEIARALGVAQSTVSSDLKAIRKIWRESMIRNFDDAVAVQLAKIDRLEREAWKAWESSKEPQESTRVISKGDSKHAEKITVHRSGDPRFLEQIQRCVASRRALLGLDAPTKVAPTSPEGDEAYHTHMMKELIRLAEEAKSGPTIIDSETVDREIQKLEEQLTQDQEENDHE